jgi:hypothetical protein
LRSNGTSHYGNRQNASRRARSAAQAAARERPAAVIRSIRRLAPDTGAKTAIMDPGLGARSETGAAEGRVTNMKLNEILGKRAGFRVLENGEFVILTRAADDQPWIAIEPHYSVSKFPPEDRHHGPYSHPDVVCHVLGYEVPSELKAFRGQLQEALQLQASSSPLKARKALRPRSSRPRIARWEPSQQS